MNPLLIRLHITLVLLYVKKKRIFRFSKNYTNIVSQLHNQTNSQINNYHAMNFLVTQEHILNENKTLEIWSDSLCNMLCIM